MQLDFYQLGSQPVERAVAQIAGRVLGLGQRLLVVAGEPRTREALSEALWAAGPDRFLAHGEAGDKRAISVLQRIVARDPDAAKRDRAQRLLDQLA